MEFKIDTKDIYTQITPVTETLNANLTGALGKKLEELGQSVSQNLIIDLSNCKTCDANVFESLVKMHTDSYSNEHSLVFIGIAENILEILKEHHIDTALNITPTLIEAIDIISMEILERDLLKEE